MGGSEQKMWTPSEAVYNAKSAFHFRDMAGQVQHGRAGLGLIPKAPQWYKATSVLKRWLMVKEMRKQEDAKWKAKAISLAKQGQ